MTDLRDDIMALAKEQEDNVEEQVSPEPETAAETPSGEQDESGETAADMAQPLAEVEQPLEAPQHWDAAHKEAFKGLPRPVQELWLKRDKDIEATITRKTQEVAEQRKAVEPLLGAVKQHEGYLRSIGASPEMAFATLVQTERLLRTGTPEVKAQTIAKLISDYEIPRELIGAAPTPQNTNVQTYDPVIQQKLQHLEQTVSSMTEAELVRQVETFASTKGPDGKPLYPYFEDVRGEMGRLLNAYPSKTLPELYEMAKRVLPEVWQKEQAEKEAAAKAAAESKAREDVAKAKKANAVNIRPNGSTDHAGVKLPLREEIMQLVREQGLQ